MYEINYQPETFWCILWYAIYFHNSLHLYGVQISVEQRKPMFPQNRVRVYVTGRVLILSLLILVMRFPLIVVNQSVSPCKNTRVNQTHYSWLTWEWWWFYAELLYWTTLPISPLPLACNSWLCWLPLNSFLNKVWLIFICHEPIPPPHQKMNPKENIALYKTQNHRVKLTWKSWTENQRALFRNCKRRNKKGRLRGCSTQADWHVYTDNAFFTISLWLSAGWKAEYDGPCVVKIQE